MTFNRYDVIIAILMSQQLLKWKVIIISLFLAEEEESRHGFFVLDGLS